MKMKYNEYVNYAIKVFHNFIYQIIQELNKYIRYIVIWCCYNKEKFVRLNDGAKLHLNPINNEYNIST
jgi:hypothetical protein